MVTHVSMAFLSYIQTEIGKIGDSSNLPSGLAEWAWDGGTISAEIGIRTRQSETNLPNCYIDPGDTNQQRDSAENDGAVFGAVSDVRLDFAIESDTPVQDLKKIEHDVEYIFGNDPRLGATCFNTEIVSVITSIQEEELPLCGMDITVLVSFRFDQKDPSTLR